MDEIVYCVREQMPRTGQDFMIELKNGEAWLRRYDGRRDGMIMTRQYNPAMGACETESFDIRDVKAMHAIVGRG